MNRMILKMNRMILMFSTSSLNPILAKSWGEPSHRTASQGRKRQVLSWLCRHKLVPRWVQALNHVVYYPMGTTHPWVLPMRWVLPILWVRPIRRQLTHLDSRVSQWRTEEWGWRQFLQVGDEGHPDQDEHVLYVQFWVQHILYVQLQHSNAVRCRDQTIQHSIIFIHIFHKMNCLFC